MTDRAHPQADAGFKPCPFCGGREITTAREFTMTHNSWWAGCRACSAGISRRSSSKGEAITAWNTRATNDGYVSAFYEIAEMLDLPAQPISPKDAWEGQMRPAIRDALSRATRDAS